MEPIKVSIDFYVEEISTINNNGMMSKLFGANKIENRPGLIATREYAIDPYILKKTIRRYIPAEKIKESQVETLKNAFLGYELKYEVMMEFLNNASPCEKMNIINECKLNKEDSVTCKTSYAEWFLTNCKKEDINPDAWFKAWYVPRYAYQPNVIHKVEIPSSMMNSLNGFQEFLDENGLQNREPQPPEDAKKDILKQYREKIKEQGCGSENIKTQIEDLLKAVFGRGSITYHKFADSVNQAVSNISRNIAYMDEMELLYPSTDDIETLKKSYVEIIDVNEGILNDLETLRKKISGIRLARIRVNSDDTLKELIHDCESYV